MKKISVLLLGCLLCGLFTVSCAEKTEKALIGKWQDMNGRELIEFLGDGTYRGVLIWDLQKAPINVSGNFNVRGDLVDLSIAKPEGLTPMTWKARFSGPDEVTMLFQQGGAIKRDGNSAKYRRVK